MKLVSNHDLSCLDAPTPAGAYALGFAATDGNVCVSPLHSIAWQLKDLQPLQVLKSVFKTEKKIETCVRKHGIYHRLRLCGPAVTARFIDYGIVPNKTFTLRMPKLSSAVMPHFLRGVLDGDGTIGVRGGGQANAPGYRRLTVSIASGGRAFLEDIQGFLGYGKIENGGGQAGHACLRLSLDCSKAVKFLESVYAGSEGLRLDRKYQKWVDFQNSGQTYRAAA